MRKLTVIAAILFAALFTAPVWSHHAAEGIISDELWEMIDDMLVDADSPHMDLVLDDMGRPVLVTSFEVDDEDVADVLSAIATGVADLDRGASAISIDIVPMSDDVTQITLYEPIGSGMSQTIPDVE